MPQVGLGLVEPRDADWTRLPEGFEFDPDWQWIRAIEFGSAREAASNNNEAETQVAADRERVVREALSLPDGVTLEEVASWARRLSSLSKQERDDWMKSIPRGRDVELPENEPRNPDLRSERAQEEAMSAPERETELRERSVSIGRDAVKSEASQYLRQQYTNNDQMMICQVCQRELPFKRPGGSYYFETVEFVTSLKLRHHQNYLALCPNHAAMFKHANASKDELKELFLGMGSDRRINVDLADVIHSIYFTETHKVDFAAVITADSKSQEPPASS